ncbi:MAG: BLUF domain-containing protein [Candidatus Marinimicrobia bacterium]|nr:BLUF domain-containing protein [Candidatus Neomarinimicrobiota bacterium]
MDEQHKPIVRLIYVSRIAKGCGPKDIEEILAVSRVNNKQADVTGALCYNARGFLQCLEGSRAAVNTLYRRIVQDPRNKEVSLVSYQEDQERAFGKWSMAYVRADDVDRQILKKHGIPGSFDPFALNAQQALGLLRDTATERAAFLARQKEA